MSLYVCIQYFYMLDVVISYIMGWREYKVELSLDMQMARRLDEHYSRFVFCRVLPVKGMFVYYDPVCLGHIHKPRPFSHELMQHLIC
jgi:hypothetical protein